MEEEAQKRAPQPEASPASLPDPEAQRLQHRHESAQGARSAPQTPQVLSLKRILWILGVGIALILATALVSYRCYFLYQTPTPRGSSSTPAKTQATIDEQLARFLHPETGESWLAEPQKLPDQGFTSNPDATTYYKVGVRDDNEIIVADEDEISDSLTLFERSHDGKVRLIAYPDRNMKPADADNAAQLRASYEPRIQVDTTTHYDTLSPPTTLVVDNGQTVTTDEQAFTVDDLGQPLWLQHNDPDVTVKQIQNLGQSKLVKVVRRYIDTHLSTFYYALDLPLHSRLVLRYAPIATDLTDYAWETGDSTVKPGPTIDGAKGNVTIAGIVRGCSSVRFSVSRSDTALDDDFMRAGLSPNGQNVYEFKNTSNELVQKAYQEYKDFYSGPSEGAIVALDDFVKQHAILAYKNSNGEWLIYTRDQFAPAGGCAKPVIYLYPTQPKVAVVKVGADVRLSYPAYNPATGWRVLAWPGGLLSLGGRLYDTLFWEGPGNGLYPSITSGTVVTHSQALPTIKAQLLELGLSPKESSDFIAYWEGKIPNYPFIRLTWFNTSQMEELAPLYISPKPDTLIRVFLDMQGYNAPVFMPVQHLQAVERKGFTVVEWGGLSHERL